MQNSIFAGTRFSLLPKIKYMIIIILSTQTGVIVLAGNYKEVNIKSDMPTSDDAIKRITYNIHNGKRLGYRAIKIIHGYGSTGAGGRIRIEARRYLESQKRKGVIADYIPGEDFSIFSEQTRRAGSR